MNTFEIKRWHNGEIIASEKAETLKEAIEKLIKSYADLRSANIEFYLFPSIRLLSSMELGELPDNIALELMRRDAHPHPKKFDDWANGRGCPYRNEERFWLFEMKKELWRKDKPQMRDSDLILEICKAKKWGIKGYLKIPKAKK